MELMDWQRVIKFVSNNKARISHHFLRLHFLSIFQTLFLAFFCKFSYIIQTLLKVRVVVFLETGVPSDREILVFI